jgi:hypothetical protein
MAEKKSDRSTYMLLAFLLWVVITATVAVIGLLNYSAPVQLGQAAASPSVTATASAAASVTPTASATATPTLTLLPTHTPTTTLTPTASPTATREIIPTLTPDRPNTINDRYEVQPMTAELMNEITRNVSAYPEARFPQAEDRLDPAYLDQHIYPAIAYQEALIRFPEAAQAETWGWGLAYSLAHLNDSRAIQLYQDFLNTAMLPQNVGSLEELPEWFKKKEPRLTLRVHRLEIEQPNTVQLALLEIVEGKFFYIFSQAADGSRQVYPINSHFDFLSTSKAAFAALEMTGDDFFELALYLPDSPSDTTIAVPQFFSLESFPPKRLVARAGLPVDYKMSHETALQVVESESAQDLQVTAEFYPGCAMQVTQTYRWDGSKMAAGETTFQHQPDPDYLAYCVELVEIASELWPLEARLEIFTQLLPYWPPKSDPVGRPFPASDADALRFERAATLAVMGRVEEAVNAMREVIASPSSTDSVWLRDAATFLATYQDGAQLYAACQAAPACDERAVVKYLARTSEEPTSAAVLAAMRQAGVPIRSSGQFDFDQDGQVERWLSIKHSPISQLEFWILAETSQGMRAVFVKTVDFDNPTPYWSSGVAPDKTFQLENRTGYVMQRLEGSGFPFLVNVEVEPGISTYTLDATLDAERRILNLEDPAMVARELEAVLNSGRFNCRSQNICDRFYYFLGLAYELSGNLKSARDAYLTLWWENSASPLTVIARMKLLFK